MPKTLPTPAAPAQQVTRGVLAIKPFRRLWNAMLFSSLGDWLGLLATTALAQQLSGGDYAKANFAIAGVFIARLLPAVFLGPIAGVIADKLDRRKLMVNCDILRTALYISIAKSNKTINQLSFHKYVRKVTAAIGRINGNRYAKVGVIAFDVGFVAWAVQPCI